MERKRENSAAENEQSASVNEREREQNRSAFEEAMHDIDDDTELSAQSPNDDLDEAESARLGEDRTDLV